jgi:putative ABC transport system permease protein
MRIGLLEGRDFSWTDNSGSQQVIIINQAMASAYWSNEDPLGKRIKLGALDSPAPWLTVAGIAEDVHEFDPITEPLPTLYLPAAQGTGAPQDWVVRTSGDPLSLAPVVRSAIWEIDEDLPVSRVESMESVRSAATAVQRFNFGLMGLFACLALVLATTGIYGVTAYSVSRRTHEIGIRMALGAEPRSVRALVLGQGARLAFAGVVTGLGASFGLTRFMQNLLFGVTPTDPLTFAGVSLVLMSVALLACYLPARRATKVDPLVALRNE